MCAGWPCRASWAGWRATATSSRTPRGTSRNGSPRSVAKREGGTIHQVLVNDAATLVYLAGQNAITPHVWTSRADRLEQPDRLVVDLDPSTPRFAEVRTAAPALGDVLRDLGLEPFAMTTGSRGLHVVVPLRRTAKNDAVHDFARAVAAALVDRDPAP